MLLGYAWLVFMSEDDNELQMFKISKKWNTMQSLFRYEIKVFLADYCMCANFSTFYDQIHIQDCAENTIPLLSITIWVL